MTTTTQDAVQNKSRPVLKVGLDVDLKHLTATVQADHQTPKPARRFTAATLTAWVREQVAAGHTVHTVYESCGFGYTLHDQLVAAGARSLVISPVSLSPDRRRKTDPLRAQIVTARAQVARLQAQIEALVTDPALPKGPGKLTLSVLDGEVCDWHRFKHRKAPASYTGCCPSEYSSGGTQRQGSIDRHGKPCVPGGRPVAFCGWPVRRSAIADDHQHQSKPG